MTARAKHIAVFRKRIEAIVGGPVASGDYATIRDVGEACFSWVESASKLEHPSHVGPYMLCRAACRGMVDLRIARNVPTFFPGSRVMSIADAAVMLRRWVYGVDSAVVYHEHTSTPIPVD